MNVAVRLKSLGEKHLELEREIEMENAKASPDETRLSGLKKQKLRMKDEMTELQRQPAV